MGTSLATIGTLSLGLAAGFLVGFAALVSLWFNYFALAGDEVRGGREGTAVLRSAYAYAHGLMVGLPTLALSLAVLAVIGGLALRTVFTREPRQGSTSGVSS